jgi:hypothetical protein
VLTIGVALAGCVGSSPPVECPAVEIAQEASSNAVFAAGREGDPTARRYRLGLGEAGSTCSYGPGGAQIQITTELFVERGPAGSPGERVPIGYGVVVLDPEGRVLSREPVRSTVTLDQDTIRLRQTLTQTIPEATAETGADYRVLLGVPPDA